MSAGTTACLRAMRALLPEPGDGPTDEDERRAARRHVAQCPSCAGLLDDAEGDADAARVALAAIAPRRPAMLRIVLGVLAVVQLALALAWMFGWNLLASSGVHAGDEHLARDGAIGVVVGIAGLVAAQAPRFAVPMLVMGAAAFGLQLLGFALDEHHGRVSALFEVQHALVFLVVLLIAVLAFRRPAPIAEPRRGPHLRAVR